MTTVLVPGHLYELDQLDISDPSIKQVLRFVRRVGPKYPGNASAREGTTIQEVVRALLDRARYVNNQQPCLESEMIIHHLQAVLALCEMRNQRIKGHDLEYTNFVDFEAASVDPSDGHVR